ncbi:photoreceptor cilium actin regulator [Hypomesus transpacificus]|uniref:photoreceptor cilium actin regulator n=1 Tax=Hypomesus transpacificus TaxID=137520 RepID=UPI001F07758F|nr:photoreceptor cilium actin regulator [Hypomesus transpacificus]
MGCSPSKGNNFGTQGPFKKGRTLLPGHQEIPGESQSDDGSCGGSSGTGDTDGETLERSSSEWKTVGQTGFTQKEATSTLQKKNASLSEVVPECVVLDKLCAQEIETNKLLQGKAKHGDKQDMADKKSGRKPKKNSKAVKLIKKKEKEQKASIVDQKVDFPEPLVKAHQAAYGFLNPSISKYEILLSLLDQATQTQVSVQPMVAFMAMRYEEINQGLREMAEEGEKLLKENGEHLAWPSLMKNLSSNLSTSGSINSEPPPDLLQQLLQYTTQRMQNVGQSVGGIGDSALEEAAEYFASVSVLLEEKLKAKHAIEARLMQLLTRIEAASIRKPGPDDSALFSEDSGIGAENESLTGSERRLRRESCESTGTIRTCPCSPTVVNSNLTSGQAARWRTFTNQSPRVALGGIDSSCSVKDKFQKDTESLLGSASLDDGEDDEGAGGEEDADDVEGGCRKRSNSSPPDPKHIPRRLPPKRIENPQNVEMTLKMKDALSGRIRFAPSQHATSKAKPIESPKTSRRKWTEDEGRSPKRPQTAAPVRKALKKTPVAKERRSQSEESLRSKAEDPTLLELERTQRDLNQRLARMNKGKTAGNNKTNLTKQNQGTTAQSPTSNRLRPSVEKNSNNLPKQNKSGLMKCNTGEQEFSKDTEDKTKNKKTAKGPLKATPPPSPPPSRPPSGLYRGRNSVKKLIDTFSQGMEEPKPESSKVLGPLKGVRKCGVPILPGLGNVEAALSAGLTSCRVERSDKNEDLDLDNLPPPPLEVLMDNSFEGAQSLLVNDLDDGVLSRGRSPVAKRATVSQRLRASMQSATVLPSRGNMPRGSRSMSPARTIRKPHISTNISQMEGIQTGEDLETEEAASLYKQSRKVIHLRHSFDSAEKKALSLSLPVKPPLHQSESGDKQDEGGPDGSSQSEIVPTFTVINSRPPATPPVLRARVLPTTPSVTGSLHRRLPSPSVFKRQPTPPSSTSPPVVRDLPTPPPVQRRLPSPPAVRREMTPNSHSVSAFPFKAPSPPASPRFHRFSRGNSSEDPGASPASRLISNARSVFCPASASLFEAHSCPVPQPPQAWTATGVSVLTRAWGDRGRFPMSARGPKPFVKRSHSDRRPSMPPRAPTISVAQTCGSEPALSLQGLDDEPTKDFELWHSQSDLRGTTRSASHPDLCIVGQALHRE